MAERKKIDEVIGTAPVRFTGDAFYFTMDGGTFEGEGVKGSFSSTVGGAAIVIRIEGGGTYTCSARDIVEVAVAHHKALPRKEG